MKDLPDIAVGMEKVKAKFLAILHVRQGAIAAHALDAWDGETLAEINGNLSAAQCILHQIAGSAGSLGFHDLGQAARVCETQIVGHLEGPDADLAICPPEIIVEMDSFVATCEKLLHIESPAAP